MGKYMAPWAILALAALVLGANWVNLSRAQEAGGVEKLYGKWHEVAIGSTCRWIQAHRSHLSAGTLLLGPGTGPRELTATSTRLRQGACRAHTEIYQESADLGRFMFHNTRWKVHGETFVLHANPDKFAIWVMKKNSSHGFSTTAKLYGRTPVLSEDLVEDFRRRALGLGIPEEAIFVLTNRGECFPLEAEEAPQERVRRAVLFEEEGSADGSTAPFLQVKEGDCQLPKDEGPCLGRETRYFYNASAGACQTFLYGGCLGNANRFTTERSCLQTCRTEAACRLPIAPGPPCPSEFWAFDAALGACITFRGCGANANKFYLEKECQEYCGLLAEGDEDFFRPALP